MARGARGPPVGGGGHVGPLPAPLRDQLFACWAWSLGTSTIATDAQAAEFFARYRDVGVNATEFSLQNSWFDFSPAFGGFTPWERENGSPAHGGTGPFNLRRKSNAFWDFLNKRIELARSYGMTSQIKVGFDYYAWAARADGRLWVPDRNRNPLRYNVNGYLLGGDRNNDDDGHFFMGEDDDWVLDELIAEMCRELPDVEWLWFITCLEMSEKPLHIRIMNRIKARRPNATVFCNRQVDTPGVYKNMVRNGGLDGVEHHGKEHVSWLQETAPGDIPDNWPAMRVDSEKRRVNLSTDGCRLGGNDGLDPMITYNYPFLEDVLVEALRFGWHVSHQSVVKMTNFTWDSFDLRPVIENELPMMTRVARRAGIIP